MIPRDQEVTGKKETPREVAERNVVSILWNRSLKFTTASRTIVNVKLKVVSDFDRWRFLLRMLSDSDTLNAGLPQRLSVLAILAHYTNSPFTAT